jgi:class 3 adenylate cyclase/tetratricopeptide (TPR) repeat protein
MKCPKCQFENPESVKFCGECGTKLEKICVQCRSPNPPHFKFCGQCGHALDHPPEPAIDRSAPLAYTPKHLSEKILTTKSALEGERKLVTVLFADVANFTSLSEKLDPEEVHQLMDGCFKVLMDAIHRYEGTINQFTGDGVMALFGAPLAHEDHAQRACHAALEIQRIMRQYTEAITRDYGVEFKLRIGLNSGFVIVGAIGDDLRMDYTAVGDTTNLAARMESLARPGRIVLSEHTCNLVKDYFDLRSLGDIIVKGKEEPQHAFELLKTGKAATRMEASAAKGLTRFVGRKNSMAALMEAYAKVINGAGQVVGLVGEAGVGKSRLLLEFRGRVCADKVMYLEGRCIHFGGAMPYLPILDIMKSYFEIGEAEREVALKKRVTQMILQLDEELHITVAPLQDLLSLTVTDEAYLKLEPRQRKEKVFEVLRDLLIRTSQQQPLVLAIEDLHWIDKTSEEFVDYFIDWMANAKILLILLYRPEYIHQWGNKSYFNRIGLNQLTLKSSAELVKAILEGGQAAPQLTDLILSRAAGNPFFMEELTHSLLENGSICRVGDHYVLARTPSEIQVPHTVQGIIAARIDRLEENLKKVTQVAAVIGREFAFRILQAIIGMREELKGHLLNLQGLEFIYEKSLFPELEYIFKHALTQEVAYNSLLAKRRQEIHEKIGNAIEQIYSERLEEFFEILAYHYLMAGNPEKAFLYLKMAGDKAANAYANHEAFRFYKQAIDLMAKTPNIAGNKQEQIAVYSLIFAPMNAMGYPEDSLQILHNGLKISEQAGDRRNQARFYGQLSSGYLFKGNTSEGIACAEKSYKQAQEIDDEDIIAPAAIGIILSYFIPGKFTEIVDCALETMHLLEKTDKKSGFFGYSTNVYLQLQSYCGLCLALLGKFGEGEVLFERAFGFAYDLNHLGSLGLVEWYCGCLFNVKGDGDTAIRHFENSITHLKEGEIHILLPNAWYQLGMAHIFTGVVEKGRDYAQKGIEMQEKMGMIYNIALNYTLMGMIQMYSGEIENALRWAEKAVRFAQKNGENWIEGWAWMILGRISAEKQSAEYNLAIEHILRGIRMTEMLKIKPFYARGYLFLGETYSKMDAREKAMEYLVKAEKMYREMKMDYWIKLTQTALKNL